MGYSHNDSQVRIDHFKLGGKWYSTNALDMVGHYSDLSPEAAVRESIVQDLPYPLDNFIAVVLEPYHQHGYPILLMPETLRRAGNLYADDRYRERLEVGVNKLWSEMLQRDRRP
jgi:hypothetical protein